MSHMHTWKTVRYATVVAVGLLVAALVPEAQAGEQVEVRRLGGATRVETAVAISQATHRGIPQFVAVARADGFPDALVASYPAGASGGPILLNPTDELHDAVREELLRLQVTRVTVFGGTSAISPRVAEQIDALGIDVHRLAGADRYATARSAVALAPEGHLGVAFVATGTGFADALAAGPLAYALYRPIVLTTPGELHPDARQVFRESNVSQVIIVGGTAAVSARVEEQLEEICAESSDPNDPEGPCVEVIGRIGGRDRTETAALLAEEMVTWLQAPPVHVNLARGDDFADAAAGGPHGGFEQAPILLTTDSDTLSDATRRWLEEHRDTIETIDVLGTSDAVSDGVVQEARSAATAP